MAASGRVGTGFSKPYVALQCFACTAVYIGRGASADGTVIMGKSNDYQAIWPNHVTITKRAENAPGIFNGGTVELTVDGLHTAAARFIWGLPEAEEVNGVSVVAYGDDANPPYVGIGFLRRFMSEGVTTWVPYVLRKAMFQVGNTEAATVQLKLLYAYINFNQ